VLQTASIHVDVHVASWEEAPPSLLLLLLLSGCNTRKSKTTTSGHDPNFLGECVRGIANDTYDCGRGVNNRSISQLSRVFILIRTTLIL
jgi:hypothetical protein